MFFCKYLCIFKFICVGVWVCECRVSFSQVYRGEVVGLVEFWPSARHFFTEQQWQITVTTRCVFHRENQPKQRSNKNTARGEELEIKG